MSGQTITVLIVVGLAVIYGVWRIYKTVGGQTCCGGGDGEGADGAGENDCAGGGCAGCTGCGTRKPRG